jgi:hypothetical protein
MGEQDKSCNPPRRSGDPTWSTASVLVGAGISLTITLALIAATYTIVVADTTATNAAIELMRRTTALEVQEAALVTATNKLETAVTTLTFRFDEWHPIGSNTTQPREYQLAPVKK